jgi:cysteine desulfurase
MECYFDNSATTPVCKAAKDAALYMLDECWGNPSSLYKTGADAKKVLENARRTVAASFCCKPSEIIFTSGGTESNNTAVAGACAAFHGKKRIVTTAIEHPSIKQICARLEHEGAEVIYLSAGKDGTVDPHDLAKAVNKDTVLVSMMYVNNETGCIQPVKEVKKVLAAAGSSGLVHVDAVQAYGKIEINARQLGADLISVSSHKVCGPKGTGALFVRSGTKIKPYLLGGGQEGTMRSGTENMPGIAGFAAAVSDFPSLSSEYERISEINSYLRKTLGDSGAHINSPENAVPYVLNVSFPGIPSQVMINYLSEKGIYVSGGSACAKGHRSYVLTDMQLAPSLIDSAVRISMGRNNDHKQAEILAEACISAVKELRHR